MTVKGRPEKKIPIKKFPGGFENTKIIGWNAALDADTDWFVSVLEGLKMSPDSPTSMVSMAYINARIDGALREVKG